MRKYKELTAGNILFGFLLVVVLGVTSSYSLAASAPNSAGKGNPATFLTGPNTGNPLAIARKYLEKNKGELGLSSTDIAGVVVTNQYTSSHNGVTHVYFQQHYQGIGVHNASININIAADGSVINLGNRFIADIDTAINSTLPLIPRGQAISAAARNLGIPSSGPISRNPIVAKLVYQPVAKSMVRLAWNMDIYELDAKNWWSMRVDAINGAILDRKNYVNHENYNIYPIPVESPNHGSRQNIIMPIGTSWVDALCTKGNSVDAYLDTNNSNDPTGGNSSRACNNSLDFSFAMNLLLQEPVEYQDAAVTNLFYWNNVIHDVFYLYGFNEASGNFQTVNSSGEGIGGDAVLAEAQDGGGTNNANFATPPDGQKPRMQMYLWNQTSPGRDGDLDNGIIIHEYGHGISNRLTGGPSAVTCLNNTEQAGEGWSDYFALMLTIESGDLGEDKRGIGTYALGEPIDGSGIRDYPYSTNLLIDPRTYDSIKTAAVPHGVGSTWAVMLWEMTWALIDKHGLDLDLYNGSGGNNIALQLVVDGLIMQPCSPGFVDARNAILSADQTNSGGTNQCLIWEGFAKRGLGYSAEQGSASNRSDGIEAFDVPLFCQEILLVTVTVDPEPVQAGQILTYSLVVDNNTTDTLNNVTITNDFPAHTSFYSATCSGTEAGGTVTFPLGTMASGASINCELKVTVSTTAGTPIIFDDMESGTGQWIISHGSGSDDWSLSTNSTHSPINAAFAEDIATSTDQYLTLNSPIALNDDAILKFWHHYDTETDWDGGVVELSLNGGAWTDLGPMIIKNPYNSTITANPASDISGRRAFSGDSGGYIQTVIDLSNYASNNVEIRFRMATDGLVGGVGWYIDDVEILDDALLTNQACVEATGADDYCDAVKSTVTSLPAPHITVNPASLTSSLDIAAQDSQPITIGNTGSLALVWNIETDSVGNCSTPDNGTPWVGVSTSSGTLSPSQLSNVDVTFNPNSNLAAGLYNGVLCVIGETSANSPLTVPLTLTVNDPSATTEQQATSEMPGKGAITGNYINTHVDDGALESIKKAHQGGKPANRKHELLHTWVFDLGTGTGLTFNANAWVNQGGDAIDFSYSVNNEEYNSFYTLTSLSSANIITVPLSGVESEGSFYIRARETDQTLSNSLNVDYLSITAGGVTLPPPPEPPQPTTIDIEVILSGDSNIRNKPARWDAIVTVTVFEIGTTTLDNVEGAEVSGVWSDGTSGSGSCTIEIESVASCIITKANLKQNISSVTFTFSSIVREGSTYGVTSAPDPEVVNQ